MWKIRSQDKDEVAELARALGLSPVTAWVLMNRGITDPEKAREFLDPSLDQLKPEEWMADMEVAVERLVRAIEGGETVGVHGDYDADGITGAAVLLNFLRSIGVKTCWHIPHRQKEGYGMKPRGVDALKEKGASLIVTVDCGVSDHEAIAHARDTGLDVIIVDHHQMPEELPPALAVINHNRHDCPFRDEEISGAGTAFYLAAALRSRLREQNFFQDGTGPNLLASLDLVAVGTVADVAPITGLNRVLVRHGLEQLNSGRLPGMVQLRRVAGLLDREVTVGNISFQLAPRINAAGRIESGDVALELFLAGSEGEAGAFADELERLNRVRQQVEERILGEAMARIESSPEIEEAPAIVVAGSGWHVGVIGIVASRITEEFYRPSAVIGVHQGMGKGSLRSVPGVNVYRALTRCSRLLEAFGGHPMAAGITVREDRIEEFGEEFTKAVLEEGGGEKTAPTLTVDAHWPINRCDLALLSELARLRPHGIGNPEPSFCARGVSVKWSREARNNTLLMGLEEGKQSFRAVGFRMGHRLPEPGCLLDIVYTPTLDTWEGEESVKLRIKDFQVLD